MNYHYDHEHDVLAIDFRDGTYAESEEIYDGFVIDFDTSGRPMGLEIYQEASKFVDIPRLLRNFREETQPVGERKPMVIRDAPLDDEKS